MVEVQVKLGCLEQDRLGGPVQHRSSSVRRQQRSLPSRPQSRRSMRALPSSRRHHSKSVSVAETPTAAIHISGAPSRTPTDDCHHLPTGYPSATQVVPPIITPSVRSVSGSLTSASSSRGTSKSRGAGGGTGGPRVLTSAHNRGLMPRHSRRAMMRRREYRKLRNLLPSLQEKQEVSKVEVVAEAARYIDDLHERLLHRLKTRGLPHQLKDLPMSVDDVHQGNIQDLVHHIMTVTNPASLPPTKIENTRLLPSFIAKNTKHKRLS